MQHPPPAHPHFDDRGTLRWQRLWKDALQVAQAEHKLVFIEFGRELCGQCRALVQSVVPRAEIAPLLQQHFVALASDCDDAEPEVEALAQQLQSADMLPFVLFADAQGNFLEGFSGAVDAKHLQQRLEALVAARQG